MHKQIFIVITEIRESNRIASVRFRVKNTTRPEFIFAKRDTYICALVCAL